MSQVTDVEREVEDCRELALPGRTWAGWRSGGRTLGQGEAARQRKAQSQGCRRSGVAERSLTGVKGHSEEGWEIKWKR